MERAEIISQILAILEDVAEVSPEDVNENSVLMLSLIHISMPGLCLRRRIRRSIFLTHYMLCMRRTGMK